ncbi:unnamed protein product [Didymodactylos carnosus]|uniref:non-specific serine/threonine protein kinase n=1 Tax=Didymodactylos carnosus TaxID=1234261 RepID=A0A8S2E0H2_9BILA|nr:unnamed protein product [Didymodactylos carnosus]CAF3786005.1 unnamed protein product [Didymodactylos carnosus]
MRHFGTIQMLKWPLKIRTGTNEEKRLSTYTDLTTIECIGTKLYPYIIKYYGSIIDTIVSALNFLKYHRILHRDVKPQNILVNRQCQFKLCDFGICGNFTNSKSVTSSIKGTDVYLPVSI